MRTRVYSLVLALGSILVSPSDQHKSPRPAVSIDVRSLGFREITQSEWKRLDTELFRNPDMMQVESEDFRTKIAFLSEDTLVVYWTRGPNGEVRSAEPLLLTAFFIDTKTGATKFEKNWPIRKRFLHSERVDCEGRIFPVSKGRFIVCAQHRLELYSEDLALIKTLDLSSEVRELWSVQVLPGGDHIFLKNSSKTGVLNHSSRNGVSYAWLNSDSLAATRTEAAPPYTRTFDPDGVDAFDNGYFAVVDHTIRAFPPDSRASLTCPGKECYRLWLLADGDVLLDEALGFTVLDANGRTAWSRATSEAHEVNLIRDVRTSLDGARFVFNLHAGGAKFEDTKLKDEASYFVYDVRKRQKLLFLHVPTFADADFCLSPDGSEFAEFHGTQLNIYNVL